MKQPDQEVYDEVFRALSGLGLTVYNHLPKLGVSYPFVVMGNSQLLPLPTKSFLIGRVRLDVHIWASVDNRKWVSDTLAQVLLACSQIKAVGRRQWFFDRTSPTEIIKDDSTDDMLYHGVAELTFKFV